MTKKVKELLEKAAKNPYVLGTEFNSLLIINTNKKYKGIFAPNGYNNIKLVAIKRCEGSDVEEMFLINDDSNDVDVIDLVYNVVSIDAPNGMPGMRVFYRGSKMVINSIASMIHVEEC